jgi:hypothetical protein
LCPSQTEFYEIAVACGRIGFELHYDLEERSRREDERPFPGKNSQARFLEAETNFARANSVPRIHECRGEDCSLTDTDSAKVETARQRSAIDARIDPISNQLENG